MRPQSLPRISRIDAYKFGVSAFIRPIRGKVFSRSGGVGRPRPTSNSPRGAVFPGMETNSIPRGVGDPRHPADARLDGWNHHLHAALPAFGDRVRHVVH